METTTKKYIKLQDLEVYKLSRELSKIGWEIYDNLDWQTKKILGDQFISATDSFGANIAEGYSRYHFLDRVKFLYNARGSLAEASNRRLELLHERKKITEEKFNAYKHAAERASIKHQNFISAIYRAKDNKTQ